MQASKPSELSQVRAAARITLQELADLSGLSWATVWRVERGMRPSASTEAKLAVALKQALGQAKAGIVRAEEELARRGN